MTRANGTRVPSISDKLYGREQAIETMTDVFREISLGDARLLLVPGPPGVGKTVLVGQLEEIVAKSNAYFCQGKFNQFQQNVPYSAIKQAMTGLLEQLPKNEDDKSPEGLLQELKKAAGNLGQILIDLSPRFEQIIGPQPEVPSISPLEARHRFIDLLRSVLQVFSKPDHPLVLFIDDWQWADPASLEVLRHLHIGSDLKYFMLITSYRDNEVTETHPFALALVDLQQQNIPAVVQEVKVLEISDVRRFVEESLPPRVERQQELTEIIHQRTGGNPFFMHAFLSYIHETGVLQYHPNEDIWRWQGDKSDTEAFPDDVVTLFAKRFRHYDEQLQQLLFQAACLGNRFDLDLLALTSDQDAEECMKQLAPVLEKGFFEMPEQDSFRHADQPVLQFAHDRVQQAAYALVPPEKRPEKRLAIGHALMENLSRERVSELVFEITEHMNAGQELINELRLRLRLLELNIQAARKASGATAYHAALIFHRAAGHLLRDDETREAAWREFHILTMALHLEWAESEFLEGDQKESERLVTIALQHARTPLEKAEVQRVLIVQFTLIARYPEAIEAGRNGLGELGINLPHKDYERYRDEELAHIRARLGGKPARDSFNMPVMNHTEMRKAIQMLITMGPPCYRSHQRLWSVLVPKAVGIMLEYGSMPEAGYSHTALAGLLIWTDNDFRLAQEFKDLAKTLMTKTFSSPSDKSVFYLMIGSSARHWFHHMSRCSQDYADAYEIGSRFGNLQYAAYAFGHDMYCRFFQGAPLQSLRKETERSMIFSRTRHNQWAIDLLEGGGHIIDLLTDPGSKTNNAPWEKRYFRDVNGHGNIQVACIYNVMRSFQLLLENDYHAALEFSEQAQEHIYTVGLQGLLPWPEHLLIRYLILAELLGESEHEIRSAREREMDVIFERFRVWAKHCPQNYAFKLALVEAEAARIAGHDNTAVARYEEAINHAREGGFLQWQAVSNERTALFWESRGHEQVAQLYWQQAYSCYEFWGAGTKTERLENRFRERTQRAFAETAGSAAPKQLQAVRDTLIEKQLDLLRSKEAQQEESMRRRNAERETHELIQATARLREEVAHRKLIEETLKEKEANLVEAQRMAQIGSWYYDLETLHATWSEGMFLIWGVDPAQGPTSIEGLAELVHPEDYKRVLEVVENAAAEVEPYEIEIRITRPDGEERTVVIIGEPVVDENGNVTALRGTNQDITEQKRAQIALIRAKEQAETANRAKSIFLANMSHEVRTPLNGIIGMLSLLQTTGLDPEQEEYTNTALDSSKRLTRLLADILDLSRVEAGRMELSEAAYDFSETIKSISQLFGPVARQKGLELYIEVDKNIPSPLLGDSLRLQQVLSNLIGNALKFTEQGYVKLEAHYIPDRYIRTPEILFMVSDTGIGIPDHLHNKLFEAFTQAEDDYNRNFQGAGLGLAISKELVTLMGGNIALASESGKGTTFYISVPCLLPEGSVAATSNVASKRELPELRILLAEDDRVSRLSLTRMLEKNGHYVHSEENGKEALAQLSEGGFDAVFMDVQMPVMDGLEATEAIRRGDAGEEYKDIPIIAMTAYAMSGDREKFLGYGMDGYVSKPVDFESISKVLNDVFAGQTAR